MNTGRLPVREHALLIHIITFDLGDARYTHWRTSDWKHRFMFLVENGVLTVHDDKYKPTRINNTNELIAWLLEVSDVCK